MLIARLLQSWGLEVSLVENGRAAIARAREAEEAGCPFNPILMDMQMPELGGYGATAHLRAGGYRGKIVALTAHAMVAPCVEDALSSGERVSRVAGEVASLPALCARVRPGPTPAAA